MAVAVADEEAVRTVAPSRVGRERRLHFLRARARCIVVPRALTRDLSIDVPHFNDNTGVHRLATSAVKLFYWLNPWRRHIR